MILKVFQKMPIKVRVALDMSLVFSVIGLAVTTIYKAGELSDQMAQDHNQTKQVVVELKTIEPELAAMKQSNEDMKDYMRQLVEQQQKEKQP